MTATVLAVTLLLLAAATAAASFFSTGPYDYLPWSTVHEYLPWFPPHAVPMNLTLLNVTWWKPEAIWFKGKYYVEVCGPMGRCRREWATIYVVQDGVSVRKDVRTASYHIVAGFVEWHIRRICAQGIAMVAPNKIIALNYTTQIWISDIYCLYGNNWFWLRLLPYILRDELAVEGVEAVEFKDTRVHVSVPAAPPGDYVIPAGWYLDPATKRVFRIPSNDTAVMAELQRLRMRISELEAELANKTAQLAQLNATAAQLNMLNSTIVQLNAALAEARGEAARLASENQGLRAQLEALNYTCVQLEEELNLCRSRLEMLQAVNATLTAQLTQLKAENSQLRAKAAELNESLAKLKDTYAAQVTQLQSQLKTWTRAAWIGAALGAAAGAAVTALVFRRRK